MSLPELIISWWHSCRQGLCSWKRAALGDGETWLLVGEGMGAKISLRGACILGLLLYRALVISGQVIVTVRSLNGVIELVQAAVN